MNKTAAHISLHYFELSENWIHTQIKYLKEWNRLVLTNECMNLDSVDWRPQIYERRSALPRGIREMDSIAMKLIGYYPSFYLQAKKSGTNLIHAHFGPMGFLSLGIAQKLGIPLVTTFYGYDASKLPRQKPEWKQHYKTLFANGDRFLVEGPALGQKIEHLGCPPEKITIQNLGIEFENNSYQVSTQPESNLRILMAGRFVEKKGFIYGLKAFQKLLAVGKKGTLTIVGDSNDTKTSQRIKQRMNAFVNKHNLNEFVNFKGLLPLDELKKEYYKHDIFMAPSVQAMNGDNEGGLPVTVIEAAAAGMALVGSRHCDISEVIQPNKTGLLAEEKDVDQLAEHLIKLAEYPELRKKLGIEAEKLIQRDYNAEKQGEKLTKIYDRLLA